MKINNFNDIMKKCFGDRLINVKSEKMDYKKIDNIEVDGIDTKDYPDFCDAYIVSADYDGKPMTESQLDIINEDGDFQHECIMNVLH
jgi:hypothetical protein|tara:strand:- start:102 stop:362 length:261 start_codon:yes stop_codon:yes gene_type:complete